MAEAVPTKESTDPGTSQTGDDVYLKQMEGSPFGGSAGDAMNEFLKGLNAFGSEFSRISDTLIQFFQATKLFLQSFDNNNTKPNYLFKQIKILIALIYVCVK